MLSEYGEIVRYFNLLQEEELKVKESHCENYEMLLSQFRESHSFT